MSDRDVAQLVQGFRRRAGLSQAELAERARMSVAAVGALEQGLRRAPYRATTALLAAALDLSADERAQLEAAAERARKRRIPVRNVKRTLPVRLTSFIEREDTAKIGALIVTHRLVTVTGPAGVGKTRTTVEAAARIDDLGDTFFVDLTAVSDGTLIVDEVAAVLGLSLRDGDDKLAVLSESLRNRTCLLVVDNCEHLLVDVASVVAALLRRCPNVSIAATSREPIGLSNEVVYRLPTLPYPSNSGPDDGRVYPAMQLFVARASVADAARESVLDLQIVARICRELDGIPLAIELAAARVPHLGLPELLTRLQDLSAPGGRDLPQRHHTMTAAIAWSYDLLSSAERTMMRRLSVFAGGFTLDAATHVCADSEIAAAAVPTIVASLVAKSLVDVQQAATRYRLLESVRTYMATQLAATGESATIVRRHAEWISAIGRGLRSDPGGSESLLSDLDNVRAAVRTALASPNEDDVVQAGETIGNFRHLWLATARFSEFIQLAESAIGRLDAQRYPVVVARLYGPLAGAVEVDRMEAVLAEAIPLFEATGEFASAAALWSRRSILFWKHGMAEACEDALGHAFHDLERAPRNDRIIALCVVNRARIRGEQGDFERAFEDVAAFDRILMSFPAGANIGGDAARATIVCELESGRGNDAIAIETCEGYLAASEAKSWDVEETCYILVALACLRLFNGQVDEAALLTRRCLSRVMVLRWELGRFAVLAAAAILARCGNHAAAARFKGCVDAYFARHGFVMARIERRVHAALMDELGKVYSAAEIAAHAVPGAALSLDRVREELSGYFPEVMGSARRPQLS